MVTFASLFSGCGGFDLGFIENGFRCVAAFDNDPVAVEVHRNNLHSPAVNCDLSNGFYPSPLLSTVDVLLAGPPCQGFSTAGKRNFGDPRNGLLLKVGQIACIVRPKVVLIENVFGVKSPPHRWYWESLKEALRTGGYRTAEVLCQANEMGMAQIRKRMVMVAWKLPQDVTISLSEFPGSNLRDALWGIENAPNHDVKRLPPESDHAKIARHIQPGQKLCNVRGGTRSVHTWDVPEVFGKTTGTEKRVLEGIMRLRRRLRRRAVGDADPIADHVLVKEFGRNVGRVLVSLEQKGFVRRFDRMCDLVGAFNGKYRRLRWDQPSLTVDTRFGDPRYFLHPSEDRGFTVREAARIQGFPDTFLFNGTEKAQYRLIGNAVPPPVASCLATFVKYAFFC